jgi:hypothetical protein
MTKKKFIQGMNGDLTYFVMAYVAKVLIRRVLVPTQNEKMPTR